jgi:hypothetical protein
MGIMRDLIFVRDWLDEEMKKGMSKNPWLDNNNNTLVLLIYRGIRIIGSGFKNIISEPFGEPF